MRKALKADPQLAAWCEALAPRHEHDEVPPGWLTAIELGKLLGKDRSTVDQECFPSDYRPVLENSLWWIAWRGREPVGYAGLRVCQTSCNKGLGFLSRAGVLRKHRGKGLQKRFIRAREAEARALGLSELVTYVAHWNCASINSLAACGYKHYRPATKWGGKEAVYLRKRL